MTRRESDLLDLRKEVLRVRIENKLPNRTKRVLLMRPNLGEIENVIAELLCLLGGHCLDVDCPAGLVATLDGLEEGLDTIVWVLACDFACRFLSEVLEASIGTEVNLDVVEVTIGVDVLEGVS
jgi:hypothetical protein